MRKSKLMLMALLPFAGACADTTGPEGSGAVTVRFQAASAAAASSAESSPGAAMLDHSAAIGPITITGANGTLVIDDIQLIVSEIELERLEGECLGEADDDCEELEAGPFLVNLLDGTAEDVVRAFIPAGAYTEMEFEVEDLDIDEDDSTDERQAKQAILTQLRSAYPSFPQDASMVVRGSFNGEPFTVFFEAEIEVEQEFATPFRVPEDGVITVTLSPELWFKNGDSVMDLRALDGQTIEFEAEFEDGVLEVEFDD